MKISDYETVNGVVDILRTVSDEKLDLIHEIVQNELERRKKPKLTLIEGGKHVVEKSKIAGEEDLA